MPKLNQIIAIEKGVKTNADKKLTRTQKSFARKELLQGISRTYQPRDDEGEELPAESKLVQVTVQEGLKTVAEALTELFDVTATKDWANRAAAADVVIDGQVLIRDAPVSYLLFLEKQLGDLLSFVRALPTLDPGEKWTFDPNHDAYSTDVVRTRRTKKVPRNHVKAEATEHHPAQVEVYYEDVIVGHWNTIKFSGAIPMTRVHEIARRIELLQRAVKFAREEANTMEVEQQKTGERIFDYLFEVR